MDTPDVPAPDRWTRARDAYLSGCTIRTVCADHGVGRSAFFERARREGWLRRDQPDHDDLLPDDHDETPATPAELAETARLQLSRAVRAGRVMEAQRWLRLVNDLNALTTSDRRARDYAAYLAEHGAAREARRAAEAAGMSNTVQPSTSDQQTETAHEMDAASHRPDSPDSVFSAAASNPAAPQQATIDDRVAALRRAVYRKGRLQQGEPPAPNDAAVLALRDRIDDLFTPEELARDPNLARALGGQRALLKIIDDVAPP